MPPLFQFGELKTAVYAFQHLLLLMHDVGLCNLCGFVDNYHEREIKYEGFGERPYVGVRPGARAPLGHLKFGPVFRIFTCCGRD